MLNSEQKRAVEIVDKPLVVIAGPGTGKTMLVCEKINYLISKKSFDVDNILALTFTNKAADEMSERVWKLSGKEFLAKTFHKFCLDIVEEYEKYIPMLDKHFNLISERDIHLFFLENLDEFNLKSIEIKNNYEQIASELTSTVLKLKDFGYGLSDFEKFECSNITSKMDVFMAYSKYELYKKKNNFVDYGDLLLYVRDLLLREEKVRVELSERFGYILVDEFQDTNLVQLEIVKLLAGVGGKNVTVVGDLKQSIYAFRGANYENLDRFKEEFSGFEEVFLHENYRSSREVVECVNKLVLEVGSENELLKANLKDEGEVKLVECENEEVESFYILKKIREVLDKNPESSVGVLFRRKSELRDIASYLKKFNIKFKANESVSFFELEIIKGILRELEVLANPKSANSELFKILKDLGLRVETVRSISRASSLNEKSIFKVLEKKDFSDFEDECELIEGLHKKFSRLIELRNSKVMLYDLIYAVIVEFGNYEEALSLEDKEAVFAINRFLEFVLDYQKIHKNHDLGRFLNVCSKLNNISFDVGDGDSGADGDGVSRYDDLKGGVELLTVHASKGKEFDYVILPYLNERKFPGNFMRSKFELFEENRDSFLEEERRLFFVACSRAKLGMDLLYVKKYGDNKYNSKPSMFLESLKMEREEFSERVENLVEDVDAVKVEIVSKVVKFLNNKKFDLAKREIDLLESLYGKKNSLNSFLKESSHPDLEHYKNKLNGNSGKSIVGVPENMKYSVSQLSTYEGCPKKYMYNYVYKIPTGYKHFFDFGTSVHAVLENIVLNVGKVDKDVLFAQAISRLKDEWISKGYVSANQEREYFQKGIDVVKKFIDRELLVQKEGHEVLDLEVRFDLEVEGKKIMGFVDRVDKVGNDSVVILDYKTSNSMASEKDLKSNLQLFVYSLAAKELYKKLPKKVGLWYVVHDKIVEVDVSEVNLDEMRERMLYLIGKIEERDFSPKPSFFNCKYCDYSKICRDSKE